MVRETAASPPDRTARRLARSALRWAKLSTWLAWHKIRAFLHPKQLQFPVAILYLFAETRRYPHTKAFVERYRRWLGESRTVLLQINNLAVGVPPRYLGRGVWDCPGDNSYWEFSGWRRGLTLLDALDLKVEVVIFINDACLNFSGRGFDERFFKTRFGWPTLRRARSELVGVTNRSEDLHSLLGHDVSFWVRSNFFAMPMSAARRLPWMFIDPATLERILPRQCKDVVVPPTDDTNEAFRRFLVSWVTARWRRAEALTPENWPFFRSKLIAILNERMLTRAARSEGLPVLDVSELPWLS